MNTLYYHPLPRLTHRQGSGLSRRRLFWPLLLGGTGLFCLLVPLLYTVLGTFGLEWAVGMDVPQALVALGATTLLGGMAATTLIVQLLGYRVSAWVLFPALLLFAVLWWE